MELVTGQALGTLVDREATDGEATGRKAAGTLLALAVVLAAVAGGGLPVHPRLISSITDPATGRTTGVAPVPAERALSAGTSRELRPAIGTGTGTGRAGRRASWASGFLDTPRGPLGYAVAVEAGAAAQGDGRTISTAIGETR